MDLDALEPALSVTHDELASAAGTKEEGLDSGAGQQRLAALGAILDRVMPWIGTPANALTWYRPQALPSFENVTAKRLVKSGRATAIAAYLDRISVGRYC